MDMLSKIKDAAILTIEENSIEYIKKMERMKETKKEEIRYIRNEVDLMESITTEPECYKGLKAEWFMSLLSKDMKVITSTISYNEIVFYNAKYMFKFSGTSLIVYLLRIHKPSVNIHSDQLKFFDYYKKWTKKKNLSNFLQLAKYQSPETFMIVGIFNTAKLLLDKEKRADVERRIKEDKRSRIKLKTYEKIRNESIQEIESYETIKKMIENNFSICYL